MKIVAKWFLIFLSAALLSTTAVANGSDDEGAEGLAEYATFLDQVASEFDRDDEERDDDWVDVDEVLNLSEPDEDGANLPPPPSRQQLPSISEADEEESACQFAVDEMSRKQRKADQEARDQALKRWVAEEEQREQRKKRYDQVIEILAAISVEVSLGCEEIGQSFLSCLGAAGSVVCDAASACGSAFDQCMRSVHKNKMKLFQCGCRQQDPNKRD